MSTCPHCNGDGEEPGAPISETETATCSACHGTGSTTTQHTPGPCNKCKQSRRLNVLQFLCDCEGTHTYLAHQFPVYAAAPDLLEALQECLAWFDLDPERTHPIMAQDTEIGFRMIQAARAAIAKATPANLVKELAPILEPPKTELQELQDFALIVSRSACLRQEHNGKCICFACIAKTLLPK